MPKTLSEQAQSSSPTGVLWDMDGVLFDTTDYHYQAWREILAGFDMPLSRKDFLSTFGMTNQQSLTALLGHPPSTSLLEAVEIRKEENFRRAIRGQVRLYPGVLPLLEGLQLSGVRQAIASSAPLENIDALVSELRIGSCFQAIVSGQGFPSKPDPAVFLKAAEKIEVPDQYCIVIEDSLHGIGAARRAGMKSIAVATTNPFDSFKDADIIVERIIDLSVSDILSLI
jgi:beta-phosphoglucomutase